MQILDDNKHASVTPVKDVKATTSDNVNSIGLSIIILSKNSYSTLNT